MNDQWLSSDFSKKVFAFLAISLCLLTALALLAPMACFSTSPSRPLKKIPPRTPRCSPIKKAEPALREDRIYLRGRVVEIKDLFSDQMEKSPVIVVEQSFFSKPLKKIFSLTYFKAEDPESWEWIREGRIYWMAVMVREKDFYLDLTETQRIRQNSILQKKLLKRSPPFRGPPPPEVLKKKLEEFQRGTSSAEDYLKEHLPGCRAALVNLLSKTEEESVLQRGFMILSLLPHPKILAFLKTFHNHPSPTVRLCAAIALGEMATPEALEGLYNFSQDPEPEVLISVAYYSRFVSHPLSLKILKALLKNPSKEVRQKALESLGILQATTMDLELIRQFPLFSSSLKEETIKALGRIGTPLALANLALWVEKLPIKYALLTLKALRYNDQKAIPPLIQLLKHKDPYIHWRILYELRSITGKSFGFSLPFSAQKKEEVQRKWQSWWKRESHKIDKEKGKE